MVERQDNSSRFWMPWFGVALSVVMVVSFLTHDVSMALELADGAPEASTSPFTAPNHLHTGADTDKPDTTCHADDHSSVLTGQQRTELPAIVTEPNFPPLASSHHQATLPCPAPPPTASAWRIMLQVFLN